MSTLIIRDIPDEDVATLKAAASMRGTSVNALLREVVHERAAALRVESILADVADYLTGAPPLPDGLTVSILREEREAAGG